MADWYYAKNGQQQGPVSAAELKQLATAGQIGPTDLVFQEGGTQWVEANTVKGLFPAAGISARPAASPAPAPAPRREEPEPAPRGRGRDDVGELPTDDDYARRPARTNGGGERGGFMNLLMFRVFIAPWLIIVGFWISSGLILLFGLFGCFGALYAMTQNALQGLFLLVMILFGVPLAILYVRVICETLIIMFRLYDVGVDIRKELETQRTERGR